MIFFMLVPFSGAYEVLYRAVIGAFGLGGEVTAGQFAVGLVIGHAVAADAFARARFVGAGTAL
jgi:hypothetical protein